MHDQTTATVTGTVSDASDGAGRYVFAGVPVGESELHASLSGFRPLVHQGVVLTVGETVSLPWPMQVGGVEQAVTVSAGASFVNTTRRS